MTASFEARDPAPAVHSVHEFAIAVPDLGVARHFYESFGLDVRDEGGTLGLYCHGHPHRWGRMKDNRPKSGLHRPRAGLVSPRGRP